MYPTITFSLFGESITLLTYPSFAVLAMVLAVVVMLILFRRIGYRWYEIFIAFALCSVGFLVGARLLNYAINYGHYVEEGYSPWSLSFGHFSLYGGMILAGVTALVLIRLQKKDFWLFADTITFPFLIAFGVMRIGCFLNGCCYGKASNNLLAVPPPLSKVEAYGAMNKFVPLVKVKVAPVYPTQLMEMAFALLFIPFGIFLYRNYRGQGIVVGALMIYFSAFRLFVMYFRELPYGDWVTGIAYPLMYGACMVLGAVTLGYRRTLDQL